MSTREKRKLTGEQNKLSVQLYHLLERHDPLIAENRAQRRRLVAQYRHNEACVQAKEFDQIIPFPIEQYLPQVQRYPIQISRHGNVHTNDFERHHYLPQRRAVPQSLTLTPGDLHASAQWDLLPQISSLTTLPTEHAQRAYRLLNDIELRTLLRHLYIEKHLYDDQLFARTAQLATTQQYKGNEDFMSRISAGEFRAKPIDHHVRAVYLTRPAILAERVAFSLLSRLGANIQPGFLVFSPRAGVDRFKKVDILAKIQSSQAESWLMGIDVTTENDAKTLWDKHFKITQDQTPQQTRDLVTDQSFFLKRDYAVWPTPNDPPQFCYDRWQKRPEQSLATPEYFMRAGDRATFVENMLRRFVTPQNEPLYQSADIADAYQAVYGQYDKSD